MDANQFRVRDLPVRATVLYKLRTKLLKSICSIIIVQWGFSYSEGRSKNTDITQDGGGWSNRSCFIFRTNGLAKHLLSYILSPSESLHTIVWSDTLNPTTHAVGALWLWSTLTTLHSVALEVPVVLPTYNSSPEMDEPKILLVQLLEDKMGKHTRSTRQQGRHRRQCRNLRRRIFGWLQRMLDPWQPSRTRCRGCWGSHRLSNFRTVWSVLSSPLRIRRLERKMTWYSVPDLLINVFWRDCNDIPLWSP